eukprot:CAMPEP_0184312816 /NCGR_PEP_ID=MMETSP1049-20130417/54679_1 /TAXON_ID=77928 /ORGANISM="Proteomonas sulcata, Strain CCMP704" /LENGTH=45 /DNA_ID= /DNA_START= /DNA_END= /DNA_ORIENTATION=
MIKPSTLNPKTSTPNPQPQTLNSEGSLSHQLPNNGLGPRLQSGGA